MSSHMACGGVGPRPPQSLHASLSTAAAASQQQLGGCPRPQQRPCTPPASSRRRRNGQAAATAAAAAASDVQAQPGDALARLSVDGEASLLDPSLAAHDGDVINFFCRQYGLSASKQVRGKAERALAALQAAAPGSGALSLERDVLPKLELLESLSPRLGWKVFCRYPEAFASPDAVEAWGLLAALLFAADIPAEQITSVFLRHQSLFKHAVLSPDNLRRLFAWMQGDLRLAGRDIVKVVDACPSVLQIDVERVLKPKVAFLVGLGLPQERIVTGILRAPEVLGVDTALLAAKAAFLRSPDGGGLSGTEVASLFVREPTALLSALPRVQETVGWLRDELGMDAGLLRKVVAKGGAIKYPLRTLQARVAFWTGLGFGPAELRTLLDRMPRLLLYPMHEPKYAAKLRFLREELGLPPAALLGFPAFVTYSLPGRIAPRAAAAQALAHRPLSLPQLAVGHDAFVRWLRVSEEEHAEWLEGWLAAGGAARWAAAEAGAGAAGELKSGGGSSLAADSAKR